MASFIPPLPKEGPVIAGGVIKYCRSARRFDEFHDDGQGGFLQGFGAPNSDVLKKAAALGSLRVKPRATPKHVPRAQTEDPVRTKPLPQKPDPTSHAVMQTPSIFGVPYTRGTHKGGKEDHRKKKKKTDLVKKAIDFGENYTKPLFKK